MLIADDKQLFRLTRPFIDGMAFCSLHGGGGGEGGGRLNDVQQRERELEKRR